MNNKPLCIYHGNCADGFGAAWAVRKAARTFDWVIEPEFYAGVYQTPPPDVTDRPVIMVDFSYKRSILQGMAEQATNILILDHHKSAKEDLIDLPSNVEAHFDMNRSGARMAWDYFFDGSGIYMPALIEHIEDRDLWRFKLDGTREIQAALFSHPYDFEVWDKLMEQKSFDLNQNMRLEGKAIERKHHKDINELLKVTQRGMEIAGYIVPVANLPYIFSSDAGHIMAQGQPFAACYWDVPDGRVFSLRSSDTGMDVSAVAKLYGGGGHKNAAGFKVDKGHPLAIA